MTDLKNRKPEVKDEERDYLTFAPEKNEPNFLPRLPFPIHYSLVAIRTVATLTYTLASVSLVWLSIPLTLFDPLLRKLGVPVSYLPVDLTSHWFAKSVLFIAGINGISEGAASEPTVIVSNHLSALDAFVIYSFSPISMRFVMKRSMMLICPPVFCMAWAIGCICIDRDARNQSIQALKNGSSKIKASGRAFIVFPEGTRSRSGMLQPFKKGAFHMAKDADVTITPAVIDGVFDLWPTNSFFPMPGTVKVTMLPPLETKEASVDELLLESRKSIVQQMERETFVVHDRNHFVATIPSMIWLAFLGGVCYHFFG